MPPSDCTQRCARQRGSIIGQCALEVLQRRAVVELVEVDDLVVRVLLHEADHDVRGDEASTASDHDVLRREVLSVAIGGALLPQPLGRRSLTVGRHELGACHRDVCVEPATQNLSLKRAIMSLLPASRKTGTLQPLQETIRFSLESDCGRCHTWMSDCASVCVT